MTKDISYSKYREDVSEQFDLIQGNLMEIRKTILDSSSEIGKFKSKDKSVNTIELSIEVFLARLDVLYRIEEMTKRIESFKNGNNIKE